MMHIELVADLNTQSFSNALRTFLDQRSLMNEIYSDNAANFFRANRKLSELRKLLLSQEHQENVQGFLSSIGIQRHFIFHTINNSANFGKPQ